MVCFSKSLELLEGCYAYIKNRKYINSSRFWYIVYFFVTWKCLTSSCVLPKTKVVPKICSEFIVVYFSKWFGLDSMAVLEPYTNSIIDLFNSGKTQWKYPPCWRRRVSSNALKWVRHSRRLAADMSCQSISSG